MGPTPAEHDAMRRALALAATPGVPLGPNPRVGCVLLAPGGRTLAEGFHRGAGHPHAEVEALTRAGGAARGATAVVTLEPCNHTGRTGPCTRALLEAGVRRVVVGVPDPDPAAAGGARVLEGAGVEVVVGVLEEEARWVNRAWLFGVGHGRPLVTWKLATTVDGYSAAADRSSRWITSAAARRDVHRLRGESDVVLAGTGTVESDDPELTVRDTDDVAVAHQPLRAVMGERAIAEDRRVGNDRAETIHLATRDPHEALDRLWQRGRRHVFLEGGPTLAAAFVRAGLVDEAVAYVAPVLLGAGHRAVGDLGVGTLADAHRWRLDDVTVLGEADGCDVRMTMRPVPAGERSQ